MNRFEQFEPGEALKRYIRYFVISENEQSGDYKLLPGTSLVMEFQYKGHLSSETHDNSDKHSRYATSGLKDEYRLFKSSDNIGSVLIYFTETGASHFFRNPVNELFSENISLDNFLCLSQLNQIHEQLCDAHCDVKRIAIVENFILSALKYSEADELVKNALRLIYTSKGHLTMKHLACELNVGQISFEKRFRSIMGITPKKFSSIVRFQSETKDIAIS